jgi:hypothetical protein
MLLWRLAIVNLEYGLAHQNTLHDLVVSIAFSTQGLVLPHKHIKMVLSFWLPGFIHILYHFSPWDFLIHFPYSLRFLRFRFRGVRPSLRLSRTFSPCVHKYIISNKIGPFSCLLLLKYHNLKKILYFMYNFICLWDLTSNLQLHKIWTKEDV